MMVIPGYQIISEIYDSSRSIVYRGRREEDGQPVIIKALKAEYPTPEEIARYKLEYDITRNLNLSGTIRNYSFEKYKNSFVMVLEDFGGESLKIWMKSRKFTQTEFLRLAINITEILGEIHAANIIHKDINPSNIVGNLETAEVKIIDFGISTVLSRENPTLSNLNLLEGTLAYISPEQTGRMNRAIDYRSDFYSLGATFYEMLTGQQPFHTIDAIELVHCHIAKMPVPPHQVNPEIPQALSDIVMKLLAKTPEERYQSTWGIKADLAACLTQLETTGIIAAFPLAGQDIADKFQISQKLYGREPEVATLLAAFARVTGTGNESESAAAPGTIEMMLVAGYSGIGKSALVQEIYKPITQQRGYFISGKFDQFQRNIPYSSLIQAFSALVRQLLTESDADISAWRAKLQADLGVNGQVIIDVIPEVELILGEQPSVPELGPVEAQNRFNFVFQNFLKVFAQPEHPLVIFLDDLQWADGASLKLIQQVMTAGDSQYLLLIGAYRDNEVNGAHPLMLAVEEMAKAGAVVNQIFLAPLAIGNVTELIADTLNCELEKVQPLAELVFQKTGGNPFFMNEFLKSLYLERMLHFDFQQGGWQWHLEQIQAAPLADNVVELMAAKIQKLPEATQKVLKLAACIGNQFDLKTLSVVGESSQVETAAELWPAVEAGLIVPIGSEYKLVLVAETGLLEETRFLPEYKFVHDRVQQAAYSLIPPERKRTVHHQIGQLLLENTPAAARQEKIFDIVNQLNLGAQLLATEPEKYELAQLNLVAAEKAKASAAFEAAFQYLQAGIGLLGADSWQLQYHLTLNLYEQAAELAYLNTDCDQMEKYVEVVLSQAKTVLDKVTMYEVKIQAYTAQSKFFAAIDMGLEVLQLLGVALPKKPTKLDVLLGLLRTKLALGRRPIPSLVDLPQMKHPHYIASMRILSRIIPATYFTAPMLMPLIAFRLVILSLKWGNAPESAHGYSIYGILLCGIIGDIDSGYQLGVMALSLASILNNAQVQVKVILAVYPAINHWLQPINQTLQPLLSTYASALDTGDLDYAAYATHFYSLLAFFSGESLDKLHQKISNYTEVVSRLGQARTVDFNKPLHQAIINLIVPSDHPGNLMGVVCQETEMLPLLQQRNDITVICYIYFCKLMLFYLFDEIEQALVNAELTAKYLDGVTSLIIVPQFHLYDSLVCLAVATAAPPSEQKRLMGKVKANQKKMRKWAHHAPANNLQKLYLVEAERYRILGQYLLAMEMYDQAIAAARENEYIHEEALAHELAAKFYLAKGNSKVAAVYMQDARYCYQMWGALAKVKDLEKRYPDLLARNSSVTSIAAINTITTVATTSDTGGHSALDLAAVMKANQAIAEEILLSKLLSKLMQILIENAGAQKGFLILESEGKLLIEASGAVDTDTVTVLQSIPIEGVLPAAIVNYVARTRESVVIDDAASEIQNPKSKIPNLNDPYIVENQPKSVLCAPLLNQGKLTGILYLENNLAAKAFTPERLEVLKLLSGQAAISIENAKLYSQLEDYNRTLEHKVAERTTELGHAYQEITLLNQRLKAENIRMAAELDVTRQLQQMILPKAEEISEIQALEIAGFMEPADEVGGDYYDILQESGQVKIVIGDVTGHGLEAGMLMIMAQTAVRTLLESNETDQVKFLDILNRTLYKNLVRMNSDRNMTLALLDYCDGTVAIAGQHEEILVVRAGGEIELIDTIDLGFPIGLEPEIAQFISETQVKLNSGDGVVLYTDGITEASNVAGEQYGLDRLCQVVKNSWHQSAPAIRQAAIEDLRQHIGEQKVFDDITFVVLKQK